MRMLPNCPLPFEALVIDEVVFLVLVSLELRPGFTEKLPQRSGLGIHVEPYPAAPKLHLQSRQVQVTIGLSRP